MMGIMNTKPKKSPKVAGKTGSPGVPANLRKPRLRISTLTLEALTVRLLKAKTVMLSAVAQEGERRVLEWMAHPEVEKIVGAQDAAAFRMALTLNGETFLFFEDESDGYRSYLGDIVRVHGGRLPNRFTPIEVSVLGEDGTPLAGGAAKGEDTPILRFVAVSTGRVLVELGTDHSDDYYPSCLSFFDAEALDTALLHTLPAGAPPKKAMRL
jgi:hypothetical protein